MTLPLLTNSRPCKLPRNVHTVSLLLLLPDLDLHSPVAPIPRFWPFDPSLSPHDDPVAIDSRELLSHRVGLGALYGWS